uniref:C-type lectin domain-containing protein n=1 Tax=Ditylenchus dipsaci TaxID=166011 RepID=A0A915ETM8_9BILA
MPLILPYFLYLLLFILARLDNSQEVEPQPCPENPIVLSAGSTAQYIHSPYDEDGLYPSNTDCRFVLTARSPSHRIQVNILESEMEEPLFMKCNDYGSFSDGNTSTATEIRQQYSFLSLSLRSNYSKARCQPFFVDFELPGCPPEWIIYPEHSFCYKLFSAPTNWLDAQRACNYEQSNLLTFSTNEEYGFVTDTFASSHSLPWIGYTDAVSEGRFESVNEDPLWPQRFPSFSGQQEDRDCVFLEWGQIQSVGYAVDDCRTRHTYICKKRADGKTLPIPLASTLVREGLTTTSSLDYTVLLAMLILLVLLLILIWIGYQQYKKRKEPTQVANLDQNQRFVSGAVSSTSMGAAGRPSTSQLTNTTTKVKQLGFTSKTQPQAENSSENDSPRLSMTPNQPGVVSLGVNNLAYDQQEELEELEENAANKNQSRQHMANAGMPIRELTTLTTTSMQTNVALSHASTTGSRIRTRRKSFERPHISALDSCSSAAEVSLDGLPPCRAAAEDGVTSGFGVDGFKEDGKSAQCLSAEVEARDLPNNAKEERKACEANSYLFELCHCVCLCFEHKSMSSMSRITDYSSYTFDHLCAKIFTGKCVHVLLFVSVIFIEHGRGQALHHLQPQLATATGVVRSQRHPTAAISTANQQQFKPKTSFGGGPLFAAARKPNNIQEQFITSPQCKCKDIEECSHELDEKSNKCKVMSKCEGILKKIGNSAKIRACLAKEQKEMERLEECVEKRVGPIGCTNDPNPKNLTFSVMMGEGDHNRPKRATAPPQLPANQEAGHAPREMSDYMMCVDECTMEQLNNDSKQCASGGPLNCALKLRCALAPPDERSQTAFDACEKELNYWPKVASKAPVNASKELALNPVPK